MYAVCTQAEEVGVHIPRFRRRVYRTVPDSSVCTVCLDGWMDMADAARIHARPPGKGERGRAAPHSIAPFCPWRGGGVGETVCCTMRCEVTSHTIPYHTSRHPDIPYIRTIIRTIAPSSPAAMQTGQPTPPQHTQHHNHNHQKKLPDTPRPSPVPSTR